MSFQTFIKVVERIFLFISLYRSVTFYDYQNVDFKRTQKL